MRAASAVGNHALAVNIVGFVGIQAYSTGRLADAVQLMDVATAESRKTPAIVQAMTWARAGRAYAKVGETTTARAALDASSKFLGKAVSGDAPEWAYWVDETRLRLRSAEHCSTLLTTDPQNATLPQPLQSAAIDTRVIALLGKVEWLFRSSGLANWRKLASQVGKASIS